MSDINSPHATLTRLVSDGYPTFNDGDVMIVSSTGKSWKLHSTLLGNASGVFRDKMNKFPAKHITKAQRESGVTLKWRFNMIAWQEKPTETRFRSFQAVDVTKPQPLLFPENINGIGEGATTYNKIYDNFFRCIYNLEPTFAKENVKSGGDFVVDAVSLLQAAESLDAAPAVRCTVEAQLLRLNQKLWVQIAHNSEAWSDIAVRLQSPILFREAMVHIVGKFHMKNDDGSKAVRKSFLELQEHGEVVLKLAEVKARELYEKKLLVERRLLEYYPPAMVHVETPENIPGREVYATDIYLWQALTIARQYISSAYMQHHNHRANDGGAHFYRDIGAAGSAYIGKDVLTRFYRNFGMSTKAKQRLEECLEVVKTSLSKVVEDLLVDRTQLTGGADRPKAGYLLCNEILDEELPWNLKERDRHADMEVDRM